MECQNISLADSLSFLKISCLKLGLKDSDTRRVTCGEIISGFEEVVYCKQISALIMELQRISEEIFDRLL